MTSRPVVVATFAAAFVGAAVLFVLSIAGFIHALRTPKQEVVFQETYQTRPNPTT